MRPGNEGLLRLFEDHAEVILNQIKKEVYDASEPKVIKSPDFCLDDLRYSWQVQAQLTNTIAYLVRELNKHKARVLVRCFFEQISDDRSIEGDVIRVCVEYKDQMNDTRIRYGYCDSLDLDPQIIYEKPMYPTDIMVAVIPLPPNSYLRHGCPVTLPPGYQIASDQ